MTGPRYGSRLDALYRLRVRLDQEIAAEEALRAGRPQTAAGRASVDARLLRLRVSATEVKAWCVEHGFVDRMKPGPCPPRLLDAYEKHLSREVMPARN